MTTPKEALEQLRDYLRPKAKYKDGANYFMENEESRLLGIVNEALASFEGDAVERVARIIEPRQFEDDYPLGSMSAFNAQGRKERAYELARRILATGLVPDEAAIRAAEREKMLDKVCENLIVLSRGDESIIGAARVALNNAAVFICGADRAKRAIRSGGGE